MYQRWLNTGDMLTRCDCCQGTGYNRRTRVTVRWSVASVGTLLYILIIRCVGITITPRYQSFSIVNAISHRLKTRYIN